MAVTRKKRIWDVLDWNEEGPRWEQALHIFILLLILANILAVVVESVPGIHDRYEGFFTGFEIASVSIFLVEYLLRLWSCTAAPRFRHPLWGRLRFAVSPIALVDLAAILPSLLFFLPLDLRILRGLRLLRLVRIGKLGRYSEAVNLLLRVVKTRREEMLVSLTVLIMLAVVCASLMYMIEGQAQPDKFPHIPAALWWSFITITTVGYGDVVPITAAGRVLAVITTLLGILMVALPTGIFASAFLDELNRQRREHKENGVCPHCGKHLHPPKNP